MQEQAKRLPVGNQIDPFEADDASDLKPPHTALRPPIPSVVDSASQVQPKDKTETAPDTSSPRHDACITDGFSFWSAAAEALLKEPVALHVDDVHWRMEVMDFVGCQLARIVLKPGQKAVLSDPQVDVDALVEVYVHLFTKSDGSGEPCEEKESCEHKRRRLTLRLDTDGEVVSVVGDFVADPSSKEYIFELKVAMGV